MAMDERRLPELLTREQRAHMNRAEIIKLHDLIYPNKRIGPKTLGSDLPLHALADAMRGQMPRRDYDVRHFPFQDYEWVAINADRPGPELRRGSALFSMPIGVEIEIERIIGPFYAPWQYIICWRERGHGLVTLIQSRELMQSILGRLWTWGWPLKGQILHLISGLYFIADDHSDAFMEVS